MLKNQRGWPLKNLLLTLGGALLLSGCNGHSKLEATIGEFNLGDAKFAFFGKAEGLGIDINNNDINDATATLVVVLTDRRSFCRDMDNLSIVEDIDTLKDAQLLIVNAGLEALDSDESPLKNGVVLQQGDAIDIDINHRGIIAGQPTATANPSGDVALTIKRLNFERLAGSIIATLNNGADIAINGDFVANHCPGLDNVALTGGL